MIKTYKSSTDVYINVKLSSGKFMHIGFMPLTRNGSVYTTEKQEVQEALERHHGFGKMFHLSESKETVKSQTSAAPASASTTLRKVNVSDIEDAKDYMADTFGISRTMMRSVATIKALAKANGVEFEGI